MLYRLSYRSAVVVLPNCKVAVGLGKALDVGACDGDRTHVSRDTTWHLNHSATHAIGMMCALGMGLDDHGLGGGWYQGPGLNRRPDPYEGSALTD